MRRTCRTISLCKKNHRNKLVCTSLETPTLILYSREMKLIRLLTLVLLLFPAAAFSQLKNQLNLDDVEIKGEAQGSKGLGISNRKKNDLSGRIKLKTNYIPDIIEELPDSFKLPANFTLISDPR